MEVVLDYPGGQRQSEGPSIITGKQESQSQKTMSLLKQRAKKTLEDAKLLALKCSDHEPKDVGGL